MGLPAIYYWRLEELERWTWRLYLARACGRDRDLALQPYIGAAVEAFRPSWEHAPAPVMVPGGPPVEIRLGASRDAVRGLIEHSLDQAPQAWRAEAVRVVTAAVMARMDGAPESNASFSVLVDLRDPDREDEDAH